LSNPVTKMPNKNQSEDSLSTSTLRTRRRTYPKERPAEVTRPKKAAKESNKPKGITNGHLLICDWCFRILKGSKM